MSDLSALAARAEAFLFVEGGSLSKKRLAELLGATQEECREAIEQLSAALSGSGLCIIESERDVTLATAPETSAAIKSAFEEQLQRDIGEAGLEVLATLLYRGPSRRNEIDYIRGVNTTSTIRTLLSRGLIERSANAADGREYIYHPTPELLAHLGVRSPKELPDYATIRAELSSFEQSKSPFNPNDGQTLESAD